MSDDEASVGERLTKIISLLVDRPEAVQVAARHKARATVFAVRLDEGDLGQLIGRQGRTARALRAVLDARGSQDGRRYELEILES